MYLHVALADLFSWHLLSRSFFVVLFSEDLACGHQKKIDTTLSLSKAKAQYIYLAFPSKLLIHACLSKRKYLMNVYLSLNTMINATYCHFH
mmetsp:Transcript_5059/g.6688  ORF Transcript_5059/g.6688 Transcript_5059/m.6688 type:complete len:91 (-) Transcript_5059:319-591(-)